MHIYIYNFGKSYLWNDLMYYDVYLKALSWFIK